MHFLEIYYLAYPFNRQEPDLTGDMCHMDLAPAQQLVLLVLVVLYKPQ